MDEIETQTAASEPANDRAELEASVAEGLSKVFADDSDELENLPAESETETPTPPHNREPEKEAEAVDAEEKVAEAEVEAKPEKEAVAAPKGGSTLPAAYRRTLKAYEWTDEEIADALASGGDKFVASAAKMHQTRSKELQQFAAAGRAARNTQNGTKQVEIEAATPVDVAALAKVYGDEKLINDLAGPLNKTVAQINAALPRIKAMEQVAQQAQLEQLGKQVDNFFVSADGVEQYGKTAATATDDQLTARMKVLELADALRAGSRQQGQNLNFDDALQLAYDATSTVSKTTTARKDIVKTLEARQRSITLRPQTKAHVKGGPTRSDLENNVRSGLKKVFG